MLTCSTFYMTKTSNFHSIKHKPKKINPDPITASLKSNFLAQIKDYHLNDNCIESVKRKKLLNIKESKKYSIKRSKTLINQNLKQSNDLSQINKISNISMKQLLNLKKKHQENQSRILLKNPFYKINKKRNYSISTHLITGVPQDEKVIQPIKPKLKLSILQNRPQSKNQCSIYKKDLQIVNKSQENTFAIRQKNQTKIYQEIKKYFQDKYVRKNIK